MEALDIGRPTPIEAAYCGEEIFSITVRSALKAVRLIFPSTYDALLMSINAKKRTHYVLSESYRRYKLPSILIEMFRHKWREEPVN